MVDIYRCAKAGGNSCGQIGQSRLEAKPLNLKFSGAKEQIAAGKFSWVSKDR